MKILLAIDRSTESSDALALVAATSWPARSELRIVSVDEVGTELELSPWLSEPQGDEGPYAPRVRGHVVRLVEQAHGRLMGTGLVVDAVTPRGWPAAEIIHEAASWPADLIVLGSRRHGLLGNVLLGSVSATVIDHAPCPVLVARTAAIRHVVVGVDADGTADSAVDFIARHGLFAGIRVDVVGAAHVTDANAVLPPEAIDVPLYRARLDEIRAAEQVAVIQAAARLAGQDRVISQTIIEGPPATVLINTAATRGADAIVVGTRGERGIRRLLHGSVAQGVLLHAHCSVLVVHEVTVGVEEPPPADLALGHI